MRTVDIETTGRRSVVDITDRVERAPPADAEGAVTVFVRHTTASTTTRMLTCGQCSSGRA